MSGLFHGTPLQRPVTCEVCGKPLPSANAPDVCACPRNAAGQVILPQHQSPRVRREKRRGKACCVIAGLDPTPSNLAAMLKSLRTSLGTGGGIDDDEIVIQGDHRDAIVTKLCALGYKAKASGG
ncbi:MAG: hypothetical protein KF768_10475 [Phycisphaeraceae bacterium]|nr:hypothetical protein [Phycisphaeraceae bacterium]